MATYLYRTFSTATNRKIWTWSGWVKRTNFVTDHQNALFGAYYDGSNRSVIRFNAHRLQLQDSANSVDVLTTRLFRDLNAWYHIVVRVDTTQSTASDRIRFYVNGEQETAFDTSNYPSQNLNMEFQGAVVHYINARRNGSGTVDSDADMVYSHVHFADGQSLAPTVFGSTDSTTGEWKINTDPSFTLGTNGFTILKDGNTFTDQSSNSNNWTQAGSTGLISKTEDCPSNVFCTINPLQLPQMSESPTLSFGNTKFAGNSSSWQRIYGTIGANTGKYYYEFKCLNDDGTAGHLRIGWDSIDNINPGSDNYYSGLTLDREGKLRGGINGYSGYDPDAVQMTAAHSGGNFSFTANDILGMAIDIDNNTFSVYKNGNLEINAYSYASNSNCSLLKSKGHFIAPSVNWYSSSGNANRSCFNFGNGYFETTAVSSAGTNASNIGIFEYNVPANYTAFSTKGLNE